MEILNVILLAVIVACAVAVSLTRDLLSAVIVFMIQGLAMSVVWILLQAPDLAAISRLTFEEPDTEKFPATELAREALRAGGAVKVTLLAFTRALGHLSAGPGSI